MTRGGSDSLYSPRWQLRVMERYKRVNDAWRPSKLEGGGPSGARHAGWKNPKFGPLLGKRGTDQAWRGKLAFAGKTPIVGSLTNCRDLDKIQTFFL